MRRRRNNPDALALAKVGGAAVATVGVIGVGLAYGGIAVAALPFLDELVAQAKK